MRLGKIKIIFFIFLLVLPISVGIDFYTESWNYRGNFTNCTAATIPTQTTCDIWHDGPCLQNTQCTYQGTIADVYSTNTSVYSYDTYTPFKDHNLTLTLRFNSSIVNRIQVYTTEDVNQRHPQAIWVYTDSTRSTLLGSYVNDNIGCELTGKRFAYNISLTSGTRDELYIVAKANKCGNDYWASINQILVQNGVLTTNELPNANVSFEEGIKCMNTTLGRVQFNINIDVNDKESDTIYYADHTGYDLFSKREYFDVNGYPSYTFLGNLEYYDNQTCLFATDHSDISLMQDRFNVLLHDKEYWLALTGQWCVGNDKTMYYDIGRNIERMQFKTSISFERSSINETLNLTFFDDLYDKRKLMLIFDEYDGVVNVSYLNTTGKYFIVQVPNDYFNITVSNFYNVVSKQFFIKINGTTYGNLSYYNDDSDDLKFNKMVLEVDSNSDVRFKEFVFDGLSFKPIFSLVKPERIFIEEIGDFEYYVYISDSIYQPDKYRTYKLDGLVTSHCYAADDELSVNEIFSFFKAWEGGSFRRFVDGTGITEVMKSVLWLAIPIGIVFFLITSKSLVLSLVFSGLINMVVSYLFEFPAHFTVSIFVVGLAVLIMVVRDG